MMESPVTSASLLVRLRDGHDQDAWQQFVRVYAPLVYTFARKRGLQDADAADLMQDVLGAVAGAVGRLAYDPARGSFRGWLFTVTRNKLYNHLNGARRREKAGGDSGTQAALQEVPQPEDADEWDTEYERRVFEWAAEQVRGEFQPATWDAFWGTAVKGESPKAVADRLGLSVGAVYVAKSRVLARLREQVRELQEE